ncbi:MAG: insulinase family protein [Candidatus Eisenbacteria bacterium]|nr:insulinase family protein [Candidatus Eisenbacteria bacterium]
MSSCLGNQQARSRSSWATTGLVAAAVILGLVLLAPPLLARTFRDMENDVVEKVLPNGMKVLILPRHVAPVVSMATHANVGSVDEITGATGLAHIFEHMAFKGTTTVGTKDYGKEKEALKKVDAAFHALKAERSKGPQASRDRLKELEAAFAKAQEDASQYVVPNQLGEFVEREGGVGLNAFTGLDQTVYIYSLPSNKLELWAVLESDRFTNPVLREFYKELSVIREERRMGFESSPTGRLFEELVSAAFKAHPYHVLVIGHMSDLETITREEAEAWFKKYYCGRNLTACVVGDVDPAGAISVLEKHLSKIPAGERPAAVETVEPPQRGLKRVCIEDESQPVLAMVFHRPSIKDADNATFTVMTALLGEGRTSRLYKRLVKEDKLALVTFCQSLGEKYPGLLAVGAFPNQGKTTAENEAAIFEELDRFKREPVPAEELASVKVREKAKLINSLDSNQGLAIALAEAENITGSWRNMFRKLDLIDKVTAEDVQRVAKQYLTKTNCTIAEIVKPETE